MSAPLDQTSALPVLQLSTLDTVWNRFCDVADSMPLAAAVITRGGSISFTELCDRALLWARKIVDLLPETHRPIAVDAESTIDSMVMMLAVLASGHPLVALDTFVPHKRRAQMVVASGARRLSVADVLAARSTAAELPLIVSSDTAMIAFTSGSSGTPKAVVLSQKMCVTKAFDVATALELRESDVLGNALPVSFGAGITTLLAGLLSGIPVACWDPRSDGVDELAPWLSSHHASTLHCTPSLLRQFASPPPQIRLIVSYGEALHSNDIRALRSNILADAEFVNWYATTEAGMVAFSRHRADQQIPDGFLPAGMPLSSKTVDLVDSTGIAVGSGEIGEIRVTTDVLADGYLGMPIDTDRKFIHNRDDTRTYLTGDLGRFDKDGKLHVAGRLDSAVKINGYLVGPAEVEAALLAVAHIDEAVVLTRTVDAVTELVAYISTRSRRTLTDGATRKSLRKLLPEWMIPRHIVVLAALPRTDRGKVDRSSLTPPPIRNVPNHAVGPTEWIAADIAKRVLGVDSIGRDEDFQALGGNSLSAVQTITEARKMLGIDVQISDLMRARNVRQLAELMDAKLNAKASETRSRSAHVNKILIPIRASGAKNPLFIVAGAGVPAAAFMLLGGQIDPERPVFGLQAKGLEKRGRPDRTVHAAAARYVKEIRAHQPEGPYLVAGHSMGGWVALEMAKILREQGHAVEQVIVIDTRLFRWLIDRIPAMRSLPAAPEAEPTDASGLGLSKFTQLMMWPRIWGAGVLQYGRTTHWLVFASVGYRAMRRHKPTPWPGSALVIRTESNVADRRTWAALTTGELTIRTVDGSHSDLTREPAVSMVAEMINHALTAD